MNEIQKAILETYNAVADVCSKNNIAFFAIGGTALGAVRHGGFIPWDDDLDIAIPIEQFEHFIQIASEQLPSDYGVMTYKSSLHYGQIFAKVVNNNTTFIEPHYLNYPDAYTGVWVDVMPMGGMPANPLLRKWHAFNIALTTGALRKSRLQLHTARSAKGKALWFLMQLPKHLVSSSSFGNLCMRTIARFPFRSSQFVGYTWCSACKRLFFPREWFENTVPLQFENTMMPCPTGWHEYLSVHFGDYMQLPPESERQSHKGFIDLSHSYKEYQDGKRTIGPSLK